MRDYEEIVKQQATRIVELERRLSKNSSNSSKPPSSDGLKKPLLSNKKIVPRSGDPSSGYAAFRVTCWGDTLVLK